MVKVSVVVPVYNPGAYLDDLLASLDRQSMAAADFEVVFVDDGSTDGTGSRLDALADSAPHTRVIHIPNSGWPGRPRNVGIDAAEGEYVQFVDHDDELGDEALQRMYDYAISNGSDVVVGKEGRRNTVWNTGPLFARNRPNATLEDDPALLLLLTPHKMFRREFLREHDIRFPEGPRRLEDHAFVMTAYFQARVISVLADYTCYYWHLRPGSAGRSFVWSDYFRGVGETLDVVEEHTEPGPFRDRLLSHWYRTKGLKWLGPTFADLPEREARALFEPLRELTLERFPARLDDQPRLATMRLMAALLRADAFATARELARADLGLHLAAHAADVRATPDGLELTVVATLRRRNGSVVQVDEDAGRFYRPSPVALDGLDVPRSALDVTEAYERMSLKVYARHRSSEQRFALPGRSEHTAERAGDGRLLVGAAAHVSLDPSAAAGGRPLRAGSWWLEAELTFGGVVVSSPLLRERFSATFGPAGLTVSSRVPAKVRLAARARTVPLLRRAFAGRGH
jgi:hypothetical protein